MVEIICEKTGLKFEAPNRRRKSHPEVQAWMQQAYDEGWYQQANEAIYGNHAAGVEKETFETIEQFTSYFKRLREESMNYNRQRQEDSRKAEAEAKEAKRQRYITNDFLRGRGYKWRRFENDEEDIDMFGAPDIEWTLYSPDNHVVSVKEAMHELASQNVPFAKEWMSRHGN